MNYNIRTATVIGAGVMGSSIAAHLANSGISVNLLDIVPKELTSEEKEKGLKLTDKKIRNKFANKGFENIIDKKRGSIYDLDLSNLIKVGNLEDDLYLIKESDWIIEVVVENLEVKQDLFEKIRPYIKEHAIISTNTSGISINNIISKMDEGFKKRFLGTHFYNPVRFMHLFEIIPGKETDEEVVKYMKKFGAEVLGKGVVIAKDTPNFIGNRIGVYAQCATIKISEKYDFTFEQVDQITGPLLGRPKSASYKTVDLVGLDILYHTAQTCLNNVDPSKEDISIFEFPDFIKEMYENKQLGNKTKGGFYKRVKKDNKKEILMFNPKTKEYEPMSKEVLKEVKEANEEKGLENKMKKFISGDSKVSTFAWEILRDVLLYSADNVPEIADDYKEIDKAMKWGYNWEVGPFEIWDILGYDYVINRIKKDGLEVPKWVLDLEGKKFYKEKPATKLCEKYPIIEKIDEVAAVDLGDGVVGIEYLSKGNKLSLNILKFMIKIVEMVEEEPKYKGILIGNNGKNHSSGADLLNVSKMIEKENYEEVEDYVSIFQKTGRTLYYSKKPIVTVVQGFVLGGGLEMAIQTHKILAAQETYAGFVEVGVGIIPAGSGIYEMLRRQQEDVKRYKLSSTLDTDKHLWETLSTARVSKNAYDAMKIGYLRERDIILNSQENKIEKGKNEILNILNNGFVPNAPIKVRVSGETGYASLKYVAQAMLDGNFISEHDYEISLKVAKAVTGGNVPSNTKLSEEDILSLEKEGLLALIKTEKTQERIKHMLIKKKPLRN